MIFAFFRLFIIAISSVAGVVIVIFALRMIGEKQVYTMPPERLLKVQPFYVAWGGDSTSAPPFSLAAYKAAAKENYVLGVLTYVSGDGDWFVAADNDLAKLHLGKGWISQTPSKQLSSLVRFSDLIKALPDANYYVKVDNPQSPLLDHLFADIEKLHIENHFVLTSPFVSTIKMIRDRNPRWFTGASTADVAKAELMTSMYLEPTMTLQDEEFTLALRPGDSGQIRLLKELQKRKMIALIRSDDFVAVKKLVDDHLATGAIFSSNHLPKMGISAAQ